MPDNLDTLRSRENSAPKTREATSRKLSVEEMRAEARELIQDFDQNVLPPPPQIEGFHTMWATLAENSSGHPKVYERLKYSPISYEEVPTWAKLSTSQSVGDYANYITCNEMVAMKVPMEYYQVYMEENHYRKPMAREHAIRDQVQNIRDMGHDRGVRVFEDHDQEPLDKIRKTQVPRFPG